MQNMNLEQKYKNGTGRLLRSRLWEQVVYFNFLQNTNKNEEIFELTLFWKILDTRQVLPVYVCRAATCSKRSVVWCQTAKRSKEKSTSWEITRALLHSHGYLNVTNNGWIIVIKNAGGCILSCTFPHVKKIEWNVQMKKTRHSHILNKQ